MKWRLNHLSACLSLVFKVLSCHLFFSCCERKIRMGRQPSARACCPWPHVMCSLTQLYKPSKREKEWLREAAEEKLTCTGKFVLKAPVCHLGWNIQRNPEDSGGHTEGVHTGHSEGVHTGHSEGVHTGHWPSCFPSRYQHEIVGQ